MYTWTENAGGCDQQSLSRKLPDERSDKYYHATLKTRAPDAMSKTCSELASLLLRWQLLGALQKVLQPQALRSLDTVRCALSLATSVAYWLRSAQSHRAG